MKYATDTAKNFGSNNYHCLTDDDINCFTGKTFEEMKAEKPDLKLLTEKEFNDDYWVPYIESYKSDWKEVTEEQWSDLYECLPPFKTGQYEGAFFFCCPESTISWMHTWGARKDGKYYMATRDVYSKYEELIKDLP